MLTLKMMRQETMQGHHLLPAQFPIWCVESFTQATHQTSAQQQQGTKMLRVETLLRLAGYLSDVQSTKALLPLRSAMNELLLYV